MFMRPSDEPIGYLTGSQYARVERAVDTARWLVPWLYAAGHIHTEHDGHATRAEAPLPIPATWVAAHTIDSLLDRLQPFPTLEDAAHDMLGQYLCRELWGAVEPAARAWPIEEQAHQVEYIRCRACQRLALEWQPPAYERDDIRVVCTACGYLEAPEMIAWDARLLIEEHQAAR
jgi:hypothetical protein